jgi:hypothetical protein
MKIPIGTAVSTGNLFKKIVCLAKQYRLATFFISVNYFQQFTQFYFKDNVSKKK